MANVTQHPADEAIDAIIDRINSGTAYDLPVRAERSELPIDPLEDVDRLRVDVLQVASNDQQQQLDLEERSRHLISIVIRAKVRNKTPDEMRPLRLLVRQIWQRVNQFDSDDRRVRVWECGLSEQQCPIMVYLRDANLFVTGIDLTVYVDAAA